LNSLPENPTAADFFQASLDALGEECLEAYQSICQLLTGRELVIEIEGEEAVGLRFQAQKIILLPAGELSLPTRLRLRTTWGTVLDLVDARLSLLAAVYSGRFDLIGGSSELILLYDAILTYLRGGVRTFSFPLLLDELRKSKEKTPAIKSYST
jgi:hypothetical protein